MADIFNHPSQLLEGSLTDDWKHIILEQTESTDSINLDERKCTGIKLAGMNEDSFKCRVRHSFLPEGTPKDTAGLLHAEYL